MDDERPVRHFPDNYSIKAVGKDSNDFAEHAISIVASIIEADQPVTHKIRESKKGTYISVTINFIAQSQEELDRVFTVMNADDRVMWVL